jgi:hypothetical protein
MEVKFPAYGDHTTLLLALEATVEPVVMKHLSIELEMRTWMT